MKSRHHMTCAERKAMRREIDLEIIKRSDTFEKYYEAMILWTLHKYDKYGKIKLLRFRENFIKEAKEMKEFYQMDEIAYPALVKLKEMGIDIEALLKADEQGE